MIPAAIPTTATHLGPYGHQWGSYKWKNPTSGSPVQLNIRDNSRGAWAKEFGIAVADWEQPHDVTTMQMETYPAEQLRSDRPLQLWDQTRIPPIDLVASTGTLSAKQCRPTPGYIEVCTYPYGKKGWLGLAQIWLSGGFITQATAKMNETYFTTAYYQNPAYYQGFTGPAQAVAADRQLVMCQEIAHGFGLDHDDETFPNKNTGTCMDYGNSPYLDEHPRFYDYVTLEQMYCPTGCTATAVAPATETVTAGSELENDPSAWGRVIERDSEGRPTHFEKDLGQNKKVLTFVTYPREVPADEVIDPGQTGDGHAHGGQDGGKADGGKKDTTKRDGGGKSKKDRRDGKRHR
jgi:hypothetical protein